MQEDVPKHAEDAMGLVDTDGSSAQVCGSPAVDVFWQPLGCAQGSTSVHEDYSNPSETTVYLDMRSHCRVETPNDSMLLNAAADDDDVD
jgi:hypothetical protein